MNLIQATRLPQAHQLTLPPLARDFNAALSYVSFYSSDSPLVVQAVQKCHRDLLKILRPMGTLFLYLEQDRLLLNGTEFSHLDDLGSVLQNKNIRGVEISNGLTVADLMLWLKLISQPTADLASWDAKTSHLRILTQEDRIMISEVEKPLQEEAVMEMASIPSSPALVENLSPLDPSVLTSKEVPASEIETLSADELTRDEKEALDHFSLPPDFGRQSNEALLSILAEAWQFSQLQKKNITASPEMGALTLSFEKLFDRLLDRLEKSSPEFSNIFQWFRTPQGRLLEDKVASSMYPLLEVAVRNQWTAILYDPATEGLVNECMAYWGANGKQDLVEMTVRQLATGLKGDDLEKQLALTHLMDARPWVRNAKLLQTVMAPLNHLLAYETSPGLYQAALLLAWDLMEPALAEGNQESAMNLLSTLHFHVDEDLPAFPERAHIARHWLFERSNPDLIRKFALCAYQADCLSRFPLLGEMAAPLLLEDFFRSNAADKSGYLKIFSEMKEPIRSALAQSLADTQNEEDVRRIIPILRICGMDPGLSLQLSAWMTKGSRELKLNLLGLIEEVGDPAGGPALRLAVLDDSEEIASMAARVMGKIGFIAGLPLLMKAAKIREGRFSNNDAFLISVCQSAGDLASAEGMVFLQDIARKKPLFRGKNFSLPVRLEAIRSLSRMNQPEVWSFLESLMEEKNPTLQETLDKIIHEKIQTL